ncbi:MULTISPECIES: hypothetical protein [unclassified Agrococcus]|uniref:hypothetical protein n=1 Tax=unclassified Agrococcus TaxID=2615065 RepID=UPI00360D02D3
MPEMLRGANAAFLPLAITFGVLALLFLAMGESIWVVFLPLAITFGVLTFTGASDDDEPDASTTHDGPA